jgi:hypothetical protein
MNDAVGTKLVTRKYAAERAKERLDVLGIGSGAGGVALEGRIRRAEHEHALPGNRERTAGIVEERHSGTPLALERKEGVHALAQSRQWSGTRILEATNEIEPRAGGAHDRATAKRQLRTCAHVLQNGRRNPPVR